MQSQQSRCRQGSMYKAAHRPITVQANGRNHQCSTLFKARTGIRSCRQHPTLGICRQAHGHPQPPLRRGGTPPTRIHTSTLTPNAFMPHALCGTQEAAGLYVQAPFAGSVLQGVYCRECTAGSVLQGVYCRECTAGSVLQGVYCRAHGGLCMPQQLQHWLRLQLDTAGTQALATQTQAHRHMQSSQC
jgi:hypothetical protein